MVWITLCYYHTKGQVNICKMIVAVFVFFQVQMAVAAMLNQADSKM